MRTIKTISGLKQVLKGCVLTIGNFDGVHTGHQEIVTVAKKIAREKGTELTAMTFEPHPVAALYPERAPGVLTPLVLKKHVLAQCGVDVLVVLKGDRELLSLSPEDFVSRFLVENIQPSVVVEGSDFNFGAARAGSIETLGKFGAEQGFGVCAGERFRLDAPPAIRISIGSLPEERAEELAIALARSFGRPRSSTSG